MVSAFSGVACFLATLSAWRRDGWPVRLLACTPAGVQKYQAISLATLVVFLVRIMKLSFSHIISMPDPHGPGKKNAKVH